MRFSRSAERSRKAAARLLLGAFLLVTIGCRGEDPTRESPADSTPEETVAASAGEVRERALNAGRLILRDPKLRKALILDRLDPKSYPELLKASFDLSADELAGLLIFAMRINQKETEELMQQNQWVVGWSVNPSPDYWQFVHEGNSETAGDIADALESELGLTSAPMEGNG